MDQPAFRHRPSFCLGVLQSVLRTHRRAVKMQAARGREAAAAKASGGGGARQGGARASTRPASGLVCKPHSQRVLDM